MKPVLKLLLITAVTMGALGSLGAVGLFVMATHLGDAVEGHWSNRPLHGSFARDVYGIEHLPRNVLHTEQRQGGFQDLFYEAALRLEPGSEREFMVANGLEVDEASVTPWGLDEFEARLREVAQPTGAMKVVVLKGDRLVERGDGGTLTEFRNAALLRFDDQLWVVLVAFDT